MVVVLVMVITITHKVHVLVTNSGGNRPLRNLKRVPPSRVAQGKPHVAFYIAVACDSHEVIHYLYTFLFCTFPIIHILLYYKNFNCIYIYTIHYYSILLSWWRKNSQRRRLSDLGGVWVFVPMSFCVVSRLSGDV